MKLYIYLIVFFVVLVGCNGPASEATTAIAPTHTATKTHTPTIPPTFTSSPSPTPTWIKQGPDAVVVPILLYHRIDISPVNSRYYVTPSKFEDQMKLLRDWEYSVIPIELLIEAIQEGARLPPRPVIITFDDGDISVYESAFPIMKKYGLTGVVYIVGNYMNTDGYMTADQIKELAAAGWEVGSHSRSHRDLTKLQEPVQRQEIYHARRKLESATGIQALTFAYPFGIMSDSVGKQVHTAGFSAAMGLGFTSDQGKSNLFWLQRRDVRGGYDIKKFAFFLPWQGDPAYMPTDTPTTTPTPSRTPNPTYTQYATKTPTP